MRLYSSFYVALSQLVKVELDIGGLQFALLPSRNKLWQAQNKASCNTYMI